MPTNPGFSSCRAWFTWKDPSARQLIFLLSAVGILVAVTSYYGLSRAEMAVDSLRAWWKITNLLVILGQMLLAENQIKIRFPFYVPGNSYQIFLLLCGFLLLTLNL
jgi:hypothetical protein